MLYSGAVPLVQPFADVFCACLQPVNIVAGAFFIVGAGILAGAVDVAMLVIGRVLLGVGVGLCSLVSYHFCHLMLPCCCPVLVCPVLVWHLLVGSNLVLLQANSSSERTL